MTFNEIMTKEVSSWLLDYELTSPIEINNGSCADFADFIEGSYKNEFSIEFVDFSDEISIKEVNEKYNLNIDINQFIYKKVFQLHHTVLFHNGKFYDSENVNGVEHPLELEMLKRVLSEIDNLKKTNKI